MEAYASYGNPKLYTQIEDTVKIRHINSQLSLNEEFTTLDIDNSVCPSGCSEICNGDVSRTSNANYIISLLKYNEAPNFMRGNRFIHSGYRPQLSFPLCYKSVVTWNNETINVWTHVLGAVMFIVLVFYDNIIAIPEVKGSLADHIIITLALFCFIFCLLCSAAYHTFSCHSERSCRKWLAMDLTGICVGLIGCYLPGVHYAYYCLSVWRDIYLIIISLLFGSVLLLQTTPQYVSGSWFYRRMFLYIGLVAYGIIPTLHWVYLNGGLSSHMVQVFLPKVTVMYTLGAIAFFFYVSKFPERLFPGYFDYIGSSHQLWHVTVVVAFLWWHESGRQILAVRSAQGCEA